MTRQLDKFISDNRICMESHLVDSNPNISDMPQGSRHWKCVLRYRQRQMTVPFSQGPAIEHEPTVGDVLECLASDSEGFGQSFDDWCRDYGYNTDSRQAERIYKTTYRQVNSLKRFLGPVLFNKLMQR